MKVGDRVNYTEFNIIKTGIIKEIGEFKGIALGYVITIAKHGRMLYDKQIYSIYNNVIVKVEAKQ